MQKNISVLPNHAFTEIEDIMSPKSNENIHFSNPPPKK